MCWGRSHYPPAGLKIVEPVVVSSASLNLGCANVVFVLTQQVP
jgi:hypothetical protein